MSRAQTSLATEADEVQSHVLEADEMSEAVEVQGGALEEVVVGLEGQLDQTVDLVEL